MELEDLGKMPREQYKKVSVELWSPDVPTNPIDSKFVDPDTGHFTFGRVRKGPDKTVTEGSGHQGSNEYTDIGAGNYFYYTSETLFHYYIVYNYDGERFTAVNNSETSHLNSSDNSMMTEFPNDSNADEIDRIPFNKKLETIANNIAYEGPDASSSSKQIDYEIEGNNLQKSIALWDGNVDSPLNIKARSIDLYVPTSSGVYDLNYDTEYLQYINLGLRERDQADLSLIKDVIKAEVTVNGFNTTYEYGGLTVGADGRVTINGVDCDTDNNHVLDVPVPYVLRIYREDYEFRTANYDDVLQDIMNENNPFKNEYGRTNDLEVVITYKITVTNNSGSSSARIRELVDFCATDELEVISDSVTLDSEDSGIILTSSGGSSFGNPASGENVSYITGDAMSDKVLGPGASLNVYLKYKVKKNNGYIEVDKLSDELEDLKYNLAEIGAYSFYEDSGSTPAGLVDKNSNPGNVDIGSDPSTYEDDTFETGIAVVLRDHPDSPPPTPTDPPGTPPVDPENPPDNPPSGDKESYRNISGVVFEEIDKSVTSTSDNQLVGNGTKDGNDIWAQNVLVKLYEVIQKKSGGTVQEEYLVDTGMWYRTGDDGRYYFGDDFSSSIGTSSSNSIDDRYRLHAGLYIVRFVYGDEDEYFVTQNGNTIRYSGQDYQSTKYTEVGTPNKEDEVLEVTTFGYDLNSFNTDIDLTNVNSLAKDNEIRRLEVNEYSTTMTYPMDTVLKANDPTSSDSSITLNPDNVKEATLLAEHTSMFADTKAFNMNIEHYGYYPGSDKVIDGKDRNKIYWYSVKDIDFGLIERPKTKLQLMNDISEIRAITSDGGTLIDIFFDVIYEKELDGLGNETGQIKHTSVPNYSKSVGYSEVQLLNRRGMTQGFRYANIDTDLLQGMTITIKFQIAVANNSEVDHLASWLEDKIEERAEVDLEVVYDDSGTELNTETTDTGDTVVDVIHDQERTYKYNNNYLYQLLYNGDGAINPLRNAGNDESSNVKMYSYPESADTIGSDNVKKAYTYRNIRKYVQSNYEPGYYLGNIYYNNEISTGSGGEINEAVVNTRVNQFIDYVDNDLIFKPEENLNEDNQITYLTYDTEEIAKRGLLKDIKVVYNPDGTIKSVTEVITDGDQDYYNINNKTGNNNLAFNIEDGTVNKYFYKFLPPLASVGTSAFETFYETDMQYDFNGNGEIRDSDAISSIGNPYKDGNYKEELSRYLYVTSLEASRILTSEVDLDGVEIDNLAEIVKVSNTAGRKTYVSNSVNVTGYIGNTTSEPIQINDPDREPGQPSTLVEVAEPETDTDFTEYVTFSPPTGLSEISNIINKTVDSLLIIVPTIVIIAGMSYVTVQFVKRKKFYK